MVNHRVAGIALSVLLASVSAGSAAPAAVRTPPLTWVFQEAHTSQGDPSTDVFLRVGDRKVLVLRHALDEFHTAAKTEYKDSGIPAQALTACLGWWGGGGDNLYVVRRGRSLVVSRRELDEEAGELPWKRLKIIPLP